VKNLIVRSVVVGAAELRFGMLTGIVSEVKDPVQNGLSVVERVERLGEMDFYSLGLVINYVIEPALLIVDVVCGTGPLQAQGVRGEV
jgi:hypothetical protein